jgi:hypothetical protein
MRANDVAENTCHPPERLSGADGDSTISRQPARTTSLPLGAQARKGGVIPDIITAHENARLLTPTSSPPPRRLQRGHLLRARRAGQLQTLYTPARSSTPSWARSCRAGSRREPRPQDRGELPPAVLHTLSPTYSVCRTTTISAARSTPARRAARRPRSTAASLGYYRPVQNWSATASCRSSRTARTYDLGPQPTDPHRPL